ncbi:hemolysin family protein [Planctomyces sp. SH-PL62]|uniref:hemolysin family protein n=1 Tax=Planctomyces sp. SH-PL62 TaxID=1636152 RepID=UPI00078BAEAA|nr:hemolysin family protein [Planctomyces sp. SH-PL62]AMV39489.1 Magnesium and cobalt efflux protein CorC [Planctomyces sp. SH-PL62]
METSHFLIISGLILVNAYFVAAEFALVKVRTSQIDQLAEQGNWAARLTSRALDRLDLYLSASQIGITVASLALGRAIEKWIDPVMERLLEWVGLGHSEFAVGGMTIALVPILSLSFVTFLHMALGEQAPKTLAIRASRIVALVTAPPLVLLAYIFWPAIWLLNSASNLTLKVFGLGGTSAEEITHTDEEIRHILAESDEGGHLSRSERMMIENVLTLEEKTARRVMIPRPDIVYLSLSRPLEENLRLARQAGHTRYPLCEDDLTTVVGMIHVKDVFRSGGFQNGRLDLRQLARKAPYLPVTLRLDLLLLEFQRNRVHLAMLLDEYGSVVGMVTLENVLEELVGPIQDEFDREAPEVIPLGDGVFEVEASCPLDRLEDAVGIEIPETDAETTGGLILDLLGRLAHAGDYVEIEGHRLVVLKADPTRIRRIRIEPIREGAADEPAGRESEAP